MKFMRPLFVSLSIAMILVFSTFLHASAKTVISTAQASTGLPSDIRVKIKISPPFFLTPTPTRTPVPTKTPTPTKAPTPTPTSAITPTPTSAITPTPTSAITPTPIPTPILLPTDFTIIVIPDTQYESTTLQNIMYQWIVNNRLALKIAYVLHEGDVTDQNSATEWSAFKTTFQQLNGYVPYVITIGNHDMFINGTSRDTTLFNQTVSQLTAGRTYAQGFYSPGKYDNTFHVFNRNNRNYLILNLEFGPRTEVLNWASSILASKPNAYAIILTHAYMNYDNTRLSPGDQYNPKDYFNPSTNINDGEDMWNKLARKHSNMRLVFSGHILSTGVGRRTDTGIYGNKIHQMLANYQGYANGGGGYMRIVTFSPSRSQIRVQTYSPYYQAYKTDSGNDFTLSY